MDAQIKLSITAARGVWSNQTWLVWWIWTDQLVRRLKLGQATVCTEKILTPLAAADLIP